jgi:plastocyanin
MCRARQAPLKQLVFFLFYTTRSIIMKQWILAATAVFAIAAHAQSLSGLKIEPAQPKVGEAVKITLDFTNADSPNCAMKIAFGDGGSQEAKINQAKDVPYVLSHTFAKPGNYTVTAEPKRSGSVLKCSGKNLTKAVAVVAVAAAPAAPAPQAAAPTVAKPATLCPEGWTLVKPGQNAKSKAFSCSAKAGTKIPEPKIACPGDLTYFDNSKKGQLGCRV